MESGPTEPHTDHWRRLDTFLRTDPRDPGCDAVRERLDVFAELSVQGRAPSLRFPGIGAHLASCGKCSEDLAGLVAHLVDETGSSAV